VLKAGDHLLVCDNVYRPSRNFCNGMLARYGVETSYFDPLHGKHGSSRPDGWRGVAAVGPAHGPQRHPARVRPRPALLAGESLNNRFTAFAAGLGLTALLQSSTATALITSSFTSEGLVSLVPALAIMLGANVGTTLIVQILSFNIAAVAPVLFIIGLVAFRSGRARASRTSAASRSGSA
jgi:hypothetical protein